jgi:tetratricopeptide (TPR) repeat protein
MEWIQEMINLTRRTINSELESGADIPEILDTVVPFSKYHYMIELSAMSILLVNCISLSLKDAERWSAIFGKRLEEIGIVFKREGWSLGLFNDAKGNLLRDECKLYERQGKAELALKLVREALEEEDPSPVLNQLYAELSLKAGQIEEALKSMEKIFSADRSEGKKSLVVEGFRYFRSFVPKESEPLFRELIPQYPHVLWAASSAGFYELSKEESKALRSQLESKQGLYCVNCSKELTKIYRCSRCDLATYCGSACQKEAWKEHKKICKERE